MNTTLLTSPFQPLIDLFKTPSASQVAERTRAEYQRKHLEHQEAAAYHAKMAEYYVEGVKRLAKHTAG